MTTLTLSRSEALDLLSSFGEQTEDLLLRVKAGPLSLVVGTVGFDTFYLRKTIQVDPSQITKEGELGISDLKKVVQFCKKCKSPHPIRFTQNELGKQLTVKSGGMTLKVPTMKIINSHTKVPLIEDQLKKTEENMYQSWRNDTLETHGTINVSNLKSVSGFKNFFTYPDFVVSAHAEEGEFFIKAGKQGTMQLMMESALENSEGPNDRVESKFGKWLMDCTGLLLDGDATIHMGNDTFLFIQQHTIDGVNCVMVIKNEA